MEYSEKRKRKREDILIDDYDSGRSFWGMLGVGAAFLWRNLIVKPVRWSWRQVTRVTQFTLSLSWHVITWTARHTWVATKWTAFSTWRATVWTAQQTWAVAKWTALAPIRALGWLYNTFIQPIPEPDEPFLAIRWRIKRRFRRRQRFMTHLFAFLGVNFVAGADWLLNSFKYQSYTGRSLLGYGVIMLFWVALLIFHFMRMRLADEEDRAMQTALEHQRDYQSPYLVEDEYDERYERLSDDGELVIDYEIPSEKRKRR